MHRLNRCLTTVAAIAAVCAEPIIAARAQQPLFPPLAKQSAAPSAAAPTAAHSKPHKRRHKRRIAKRIIHTAHKNPVVEAVLPPTDPKVRLSTRLRLGDGVRMWRPSRKEIGVAYAPGGSDASASGAFKFTVDRAALRKYLTKTAPYIKRSPVSAKMVVDASATNVDAQQVPAKIIPEINGAVLDVDAAVDIVSKSIQNDPATVHIVLPIKTKPARVTAGQLKGINARIGYFVTRFNPGDAGRTQTVRRAIDIIDGSVIPPQGVFSVNHTVGERTAERGFGKGHVFVDGKMEIQQGGGMCQVATTLFNAAMLADLKIVERHQHVRTIPYADPGRDATVYWGQKDLKIQNLTPAPVYISYKTTRNHAIVSIFGPAAPGRVVKLVSHYQKLGERHYTGVFYRIVKNADGTVVKDKPFRSAYKWTPALDFSR